MPRLTKDYGKYTTYIDIDMWDGDEFIPHKYGADSWSNDLTGEYSGWIYNDWGEKIGDFTTDDSTLISDNFLVDFNVPNYAVHAATDVPEDGCEELPFALENFLEDVSQSFGPFDYDAFMGKCWTKEDLRKLTNFRRRWNRAGENEDENKLQSIADEVGQFLTTVADGDIDACDKISCSTDIKGAVEPCFPSEGSPKYRQIFREACGDCFGFADNKEKVTAAFFDWCAMKVLIKNYELMGMSEADARRQFWDDVRAYNPNEYDRLLKGFNSMDDRIAKFGGDYDVDELRNDYLLSIFTEERGPDITQEDFDEGIYSSTKYGADMCSIGASSKEDSVDSNYPYYLDKQGVFDGYFEDQTDVLSIFELQSIYDTLVSDGDISAGSFNSFEDWLQANVDNGLLSGMWMSDAQRCDMPAEFGGYYPDDDYEEDEFDDDIYRVIFPNFDEAAAAESLLDAEGIWYDWGDGDRMLLRRDGLSMLTGSDIDFDEM